jgi:hypothetical protein
MTAFHPDPSGIADPLFQRHWEVEAHQAGGRDLADVFQRFVTHWTGKPPEDNPNAHAPAYLSHKDRLQKKSRGRAGFAQERADAMIKEGVFDELSYFLESTPCLPSLDPNCLPPRAAGAYLIAAARLKSKPAIASILTTSFDRLLHADLFLFSESIFHNHDLLPPSFAASLSTTLAPYIHLSTHREVFEVFSSLARAFAEEERLVKALSPPISPRLSHASSPFALPALAPLLYPVSPGTTPPPPRTVKQGPRELPSLFSGHLPLLLRPPILPPFPMRLKGLVLLIGLEPTPTGSLRTVLFIARPIIRNTPLLPVPPLPKKANPFLSFINKLIEWIVHIFNKLIG